MVAGRNNTMKAAYWLDSPMAPAVRPSSRIRNPKAHDAECVENGDDVGEDRAEQESLDHLHRLFGGPRAEQEDEEEDVVIDQFALEANPGRSEVIVLVVDDK
jgi:hypothetical protein